MYWGYLLLSGYPDQIRFWGRVLRQVDKALDKGDLFLAPICGDFASK